jgi:acyl carrier protein
METVEKKLLIILRKYTPNPEVWNNYTREFGLVKDLKINSARIVDIILDIEEEFKINVKDEDIEKMKSTGDIIKFIYDKTS